MAATSVVAMHMSDGMVSAPTSLLFVVVAVAAVGFCPVRARAELDERTAPMAGLVAAFIFAVQMVNFPILPGVSGHLLGGALAAILVGPYTGALCVAIVLVVQSLLFADGGLTALGTNITNMAVIGVVAGYGVGGAGSLAGPTQRLSFHDPRRLAFAAALSERLRGDGLRPSNTRSAGPESDVAGHGRRLHVRHPRADRHRRRPHHRRHGGGRRRRPARPRVSAAPRAAPVEVRA